MRVSTTWVLAVVLGVAAACGSPDAGAPPTTADTSSGGAVGTADATAVGGPTTSSGVGPSTTAMMDGSSSGMAGAGSGGATSTGRVVGSTDGLAADGSTSATSTGGNSTTTDGASVDGNSTTFAMGGGSATSSAGGASSTSSEASTTGGVAECASGPLDAPLSNCSPEPVPDTGDYYADCVARINQFRWECQCLPPLERWVEGEGCADQQAEYDYQEGSAHAGFRAGICSLGGYGQNECPDYGPNFGIVDFCLQQMWDEGPGEDFQVHGHYLNMSDESFSRVACGMYVTPEGNVWAVQNFQ